MKYSLLRDESMESSKTASLQSARSRYWEWLGPFLSVVSLTSLFVNVVTLQNLRSPASDVPEKFLSSYAGLEFDFLTSFRRESPFSSVDRAIQDAACASDHLLPSRLSVALNDSYTESIGVPHSMRWPWDAQKGVYILHSGHEMHCLHLLRNSLNDVHDGATPQWSYGHQIHCLEMLLQSVMCTADDTLLYVGYLHENAKHEREKAVAGEGSSRTCRDWTKLRAWADEHSACYKRDFRKDDPNVNEFDKYKFCPDGRRPWEHVQAS